MKDFVAGVGVINIDILYSGLPKMPELGEEVKAKHCAFLLGGGSVASLVTLSRLGIDSRLGTFLSDDLMDVFARKKLDVEPVSYKNLYAGKNSPIAITSIASFPSDRYFLTYYPDNADIYCSDDDLYRMLTGSKVCIAQKGHNEVFKQLKQEGTIIVLDTGWSEEMNLENFKEILKYVDVFTPNEKEAMKISGENTPQAALDSLTYFVEHPIVKLGKHGCITKQSGSILYVPSLNSFKAVDTTGAGDAFLAGVIYGLYMGWELDKCLKMGNITGGNCTTEVGCLEARLNEETALRYLGNYAGRITTEPFGG